MFLLLEVYREDKSRGLIQNDNRSNNSVNKKKKKNQTLLYFSCGHLGKKIFFSSSSSFIFALLLSGDSLKAFTVGHSFAVPYVYSFQ